MLWRIKALSAITFTLGTPLGAQRLGKAYDRPTTLIGVIVKYGFGFSNNIDIIVETT